MSASQSRLDLRIDVFEKTDQRALALPDLTPPELVEAILREFRELEYLGNVPADYQLLKAEDNSPLDNANQLQQQSLKTGRLILVENKAPLPKGVQRPTQDIYLREQTTNKVYKLHWQPAIIGRPDKNQPHNELVAINLDSYQTGLRISRRHAVISEEAGQYYIQSLSRNPTALKRSGGETVAVTAKKQLLRHGDIIYLERSNIALKFIVRPHKNGG